MNLKPLVIFGLAAALTSSSLIAIAPERQTAIAKETTVAKTGQFVSVAHPSQGTARIVTENGKRYLVLDSSFQTDEGPDLFVLLHRSDIPKDYDSENYVSLGRLQTVKGGQRYEIPPEVDLDLFRSTVVWCRQFNVTFGYAPLQ